MNSVRVRFAPSPTGRLHIGGLRSALYNYLFAKKQNGVFILRIEDTDRKRLVPGAVEDIVDTLQAYGLTPDEGPVRRDGKIIEQGTHGPYVQSQRLTLYQEAVQVLLEQGSAYPCFCSAERLAKLRESQEQQHLPPGYDGHCREVLPDDAQKRRHAGETCVIRFRVPHEGTTTAQDVVRGTVQFRNALLEDAVLMKSDGYPTYHLANVVDDHAMEISHVIRAEEWLSSLPLHLLLYQAFGWNPPTFAHLPHVLGAGRKKLSKRDGDTAAGDYLKEYLPRAVLNFIALLGWNPKTNKEYYPTVEELVADFDLAKVNKSGAIFDVQKLTHLHQLHLRATPVDEIRTAAQLPCTAEEARRYLPLVLERAERLSDLAPAIAYLIGNVPEYDADLLIPKQGSRENTKNILKDTAAWLTSLPQSVWGNAAEMRERCLQWIIERKRTNQETLWPLRVALTGSRTSPDVFDSAVALGSERTVERVQAALARL